MNTEKFFEMELICPFCSTENQREIMLTRIPRGYHCNNCQKTYPLKNLVYTLKNKCETEKCNWECERTCRQNAISKFSLKNRGYFTLGYLIRNLKIAKASINEKCNNCAACVEKCPLEAIITVETPIFLIPVAADTAHGEVISESKKEKGTDVQLRRPLKEKEMRPIIDLLYEKIIEEIKSMEKNKKIGLIVDNGCGANILRVFLPEKNILSLDISTDHNAFYPLDAIINGEHLPLKKESVDLFTSINVLEHVTNPVNYLNEIKRTLKKEGTLIIALPTPWWHVGKLLAIHQHLNYWLHIFKNPVFFLKNPLKDFNEFWAHEKDCNYEGTKQAMTLSREIKQFSAKNWERLFNNCGLIVKKKINIGNVLANNILLTSFTKKLGNSPRRPIHFIYLLKKHEKR